MSKQLQAELKEAIYNYTNSYIEHINELVEDLTEIIINDMISKLQAEIKA